MKTRKKLLAVPLALCMVLSLLFSLTGCGSDLSSIHCTEQGFTTKFNSSYAWKADETDGLYIYLKSEGAIPYVHISWINGISSVDDAREYMSETLGPAIKEAGGDNPFQSSETSNEKIGGKKLPAGEYIYNEQGQSVTMLVAFDTSGDNTVVYQAKYLSEDEKETKSALNDVVRNFKADDNPKASNANPSLVASSSPNGTTSDNLALVSCPEQGFTTKANSKYPWKYVEGDGITIWTNVENSIPFVLVFKANGVRENLNTYIHDEFTPSMQEDYGSNLLDYKEYDDYEIGGKKLHAGLYTYKSSQGNTLEMLRLVDSVDGCTIEYSAKYLKGEGEVTLAALDTAIRNFQSNTGTNS